MADSAYWLVLLASLSLVSVCHGAVERDCSGCVFTKHKKQPTTDMLAKLQPLCGNRYTVTKYNESDEYVYKFGICTTAFENSNSDLKDVAAAQKKIKDGPTYMLGNLSQTELMIGSNFIYLEYEGGENYTNQCGKEPRRAILLITCQPGLLETQPIWLEESLYRTEECHYLFEMAHDAACSKLPTQEIGLSAGSIVCIVLIVVLVLYLVLGSTYMRCMKGAKGWRQIPNYEFWRDFGNLQADGCDLICRCGGGGRNQNGKQYHGIGDQQIESTDGFEDRDDHLLPM